MLTKQQTPIAFSGNIPVYYDSYLGPMFFEPYAHDMADRIKNNSPTNLLEVAAGTGRLTKLLPGSVKKGATIIASDINPAMVNFGKSKIAFENIKWVEADAVSLPFADESFDGVVSQFGVMFYSDKIKAYREAYRVLKPGGILLFNCWDEIVNNPMANLTNEALKHFFPIDTPAFYTVPFSYYDEKVITSELQQAGFKNTNIDLVALTGYGKTAADAASGLIKGTPTVTAIEERDADALPKVLEYLEKQIATRFGAESLQVPLQARVVMAVKD